MSVTYENALQRMQVLNQFMDQVTPQLQQLGVDRSGYKGYAQAYQSAVNNNLAVPQDFADIMYQYGGYGNTGKQLFEPSKDGNPKLTQEGIAYASRNLPEGVALHQGFFDFGRQVSDLAKSKGDNTTYKTLQQQINAAAGYGMEIPQHIQDLSYAAGFGGTPAPTPAVSTPTPAAPTPTPTPAPAKFAANEGTANKGGSDAPEFLAQFKKRLQEKAASEAASDTPTGTYAEVTGDNSTKGGRDKPNEELREARSRFARDSRRSSGRRGSRSGRASSNREAQGRAADRAASLGRAVYESRRSSSRRGTDFGPGRARRDSSSSAYSDSRRDRSFERPGRPFRNRFRR
jgi:hypothetical protein